MDKAKNGGRIFIAKNRNGPDGIVFPIFMDTSNVKIDVLPEAIRTAVNGQRLWQKRKNFMREKYIKYMTKNGGSNVSMRSYDPYQQNVRRFRLSEVFIDQYRDKEVPWGPIGIYYL